MALGYQDELTSLFAEDKYVTIEEMETIKKKQEQAKGDAHVLKLPKSLKVQFHVINVGILFEKKTKSPQIATTAVWGLDISKGMCQR